MHFVYEGLVGLATWGVGWHFRKTRKPFIVVIEDAEVVIIIKENHQILIMKFQKQERFFSNFSRKPLLVVHQERLMDNLSLTAEERFEKFCSKYPT